MAHFPKPFFRPVRNLWYVQIDGRQINLGADKDAARSTEQRTPTVGTRTASNPSPSRLMPA